MKKKIVAQVEFIKSIGAFDEQYYLTQFDESSLPEVDLVQHYLETGFRESKDPSIWFDTSYYLSENDDVAKVGINPLLHYLQYGIVEKRKPTNSISLALLSSLDEVEYTAEKLEILNKHQLLLKSLPNNNSKVSLGVKDEFITLVHAVDQKIAKNPYFDAEWYGNTYGVPVEKSWEHFCELGTLLYLAPCKQLLAVKGKMKEFNQEEWFTALMKLPHRLNLIDYNELNDIQKCYEVYVSGLFDKEWYINHYPDLRDSVDALMHFSIFGVYENHSPNELFNQEWYKENYSLIDSQIPLVHYLKNWRNQAFNPSLQFDVNKYLLAYKDVAKEGVEPLAHYIKIGRSEGRVSFSSVGGRTDKINLFSESPLFIAEWYNAVNEDLRDMGLDTVKHYSTFGEKEGRKPNPYFNPIWYKKQYSLDDEQSPLFHYLMEGFSEGNATSPEFDSKAYLNHYDLQNIEISALEHFLTIGRKQGFKPIAFTGDANQTLKKDKTAKLVDNPALRSFLDTIEKPLNPTSQEFYSNRLNIHWVIPDFAKGAGGHMTIFRTIRWLEIFGHTCTIWIYNPSMNQSGVEGYETIVKHFQQIKAEVKIVENGFDQAEGDAIFATDWGSMNYVTSASNFKRRFYFVQDYEPEFYAMGSLKLAALQSYNHDVDCICASPWLSQLMQTKHNLWATPFHLAYDKEIYNQDNITRQNSNEVFKIAFYARHFTERRAVELGLLALEQLGKWGLPIEVHTFGAPLKTNSAPFKLVDHGVVSPNQLAEFYKDCDLGIVFSATNYSLIPQEMMACGIPVCELDTESTRAIFNEDIVKFLNPNPRIMAEQIKSLLFKYEELNAMAERATEWVNQFSWEKSARIVEQGILERLAKKGFKSVEYEVSPSEIKASVIIPTYNGGEPFKHVLDALMKQRAPWPYEVVIVDSGSKDGTIEYIHNYPEVKLLHIDSKDFQHGRTRNYAIEHTRGEFVAVLTHDALPADEFWLYNIVSLLEHYPDAAGAFGRHFAYNDADPYTKKDLIDHFNGFDNFPINLSKYTDEEKYNSEDRGWRQVLHFYSDNNSCMRKSVWEKIPYPEVPFGEDQAWAKLVTDAGYEKLYSKAATVYHSHDFDYEETRKRASEEAEFFASYFGYEMVNENTVNDTISDLNQRDRQYGESVGWDEATIENRMQINEARILGFIDGQKSVFKG
ncbi:glycosyltransferase [Psychrobacter sp. Marseille-P5312]|uniref:rhamnosyltransferase WsaF family glycosyltransferase n=1 Tax=Psychrobacter sp. Marseille-P5312 TaxID=2086574 RepID=UPI000CF6BFCE|nr:glycosyltransferase [Psychrobacter sp. Marseille-P5312]